MIEKDTPMMKQFKKIKEKHPDAFLFFRCGDFYEMFGSDAVEASSILDITLTKRGDIPMCGVPYHAVDVYIAKMIKSGNKIAICEQLEDPKLVKGIVKRDVTQVITPGTLIEENILSNKSNNFLFALNIKGLYIEISYLDLSTGDFEVNEIEYTNDLSLLKGELIRINPKEILIPENIWANNRYIRGLFEEHEHILVNRFPCWYFEEIENKENILKHFNINSFQDIGISKPNTDITTPGAILRYVKDNAKSLIDHIRTLNYYNSDEKMILDETTIKNLELLRNLRDDSTVNTLLEVLDKTITSMGGRLLKKWIINPLIKENQIIKRQNAVTLFYTNQNILNKIEKSLRKVMDLERLVARIVMDKATPKDLVSLKLSLTGANEVHEILKNYAELKDYLKGYDFLNDIIDIIDKTIKDEPSSLINEGNIVKDGYLKKLDELKDISLKSKEYITKIEKREKEKFNTPSLRIKYNRVLGYFFEISKLQSNNLDDSFILRQSLVNTHRYTSPELSTYESKVLTARDEINKIEEEIFYEIKNKVLKKIDKIQDNAKIVAQIDVFLSFAKIAINNHYICPEINNSNKIIIKESRHPVIEQKLELGDFIPNDLDMDTEKDYLLIITGPNMSGKSTYLRQNALIVLMTQIGSYVPAQSAKIGVVDRIFTRIGSSDNLARGQSTFLVEMIETANILKNATNRSFIIMDEIGRGTSTFDGLSIAWAVLEYIHNKKVLGAKTLFATHYHELTKLDKKEGIKNYSIAISENNEEITFLHKIIEGPSEKSYGIHVANLASLPEEVILYSEGLLKKLEQNKNDKLNIKSIVENNQMELFDFTGVKENKKKNDIIGKIKFIDINKLTPLEAINILSDLQNRIKSGL